jgi:heat shock protein HslJ
MTTKTKILAPLLLFALALTGCGRAPVTQAGAAGTEPGGRTFLSTSVTEEGQPRPLVAGTRIRLSFSDDHHVGAQAGCNSMGGAARFSGGRLLVDDLATTDMGCDPARHAQDDWLARFLTSRPAWSADGTTLILENASTRIVFEDREVADPNLPLRGTRWLVDTIIDGESASSVPAGAEASITFEDGDRFGGSTGCNGMGGTATIHGQTISFSDVITTKMACDPDRNRLERAVLSVLDGDTTYRIEADRLSLNNPNGHGLGLRAAS